MTGGRHVVVVAAGDVPARAALDGAWPGWADGVDAVVAADGGPRRGRRARPRPDGGRRRPGLGRRRLASRRPPRRACRSSGPSSDKDESDTELAVLEAVRLGATRITVLGALGGPRLDHELANVWLLALDGAGRRPDGPARRAGPGDARSTGARARTAGAVRRQLPGVVGATRVAAAVRRRRRGRDDRRPCATRCATSRSPPARRAACPTCATGADAAVTIRARPAAHRRVGDVSLEAVPAAGGLSSTP